MDQHEIRENLKVRGFNCRKIGDDYHLGDFVFPVSEAYSAFLKQYKKEDTEESGTEFLKLMDKFPVRKRMVIRLCELFVKIEEKKETMLVELECFVGVSSPEKEFTCVSPFEDSEP
jgi:hypothetical protein